MRKISPILGVVFLALAVVVFVYAEGARRFYSGGFFALLGIVLLVNSIRHKQ